MNDPHQKPTPSNPFQPGLLGVGLLFASVFLGQSREPGGIIYIGRFLFLIAVSLIVWSLILWYKQAQHPEEERDPEV